MQATELKPNSAIEVYRVALPVPLATLFDYLPPQADTVDTDADTADSLQAGVRVLVPFGSRKLVGVVVAHHHLPTAPEHALKPIAKVLDPRARLAPDIIELCEWLSHYYQHPLGEVLNLALPPYFRSDNPAPKTTHWVHTREGMGLSDDALKRSKRQQQIHQYLMAHHHLNDEHVRRHGFSRQALKALAEKKLIAELEVDEEDQPSQNLQLLKQTPQSPNAEQQRAIDAIRFHHFSCSLLHGATGSGKTEVYLQLAEKVLQMRGQVLVLIPEIGLTPQTAKRFRDRFNVPIAELHSDISDKARAQYWLDADKNRASIVIGTRLSALTPMPKLGLIIVDEEHDLSYKQQESVRYSARDLAIYRARKCNIPIVLGSATPALESLYNASRARYQHLVLKQRASKVDAPRFEVVDARNATVHGGLTDTALAAIRDTLERGQQALVFLNRRGFAPVLLCHACGWMSDCAKCSASMTMHTRPARLHCHHCDLRRPIPQVCPSCNSTELISEGFGTEQLEQCLRESLPDIDILRIDRDNTKTKSALERSLTAVESGEPCVLVGTQMLAKGHHFAKLNLVVVVDADQGFLSPNFRAMEQAGQLLMQVAGRAGRESEQGIVMLQTRRPDHPLIQIISTRGYTRFARQLLKERELSNLPPFWHCAIFRSESKRAENAQQVLTELTRTFSGLLRSSPTLQHLGPLPSAMEKVQERFRFQLMLKASTRGELNHILSLFIDHLSRSALAKRVRWSIDVDPLDSS